MTAAPEPGGRAPDAPEPAAQEPIDLLVERFLQEVRGGAPANVEAYAAAHPEHAANLRELLPTLLALEQVKRDRESSTGSGRPRLALPPLERLGDFRIVREIGRGGMGVVFEAEQESLGRRVALKVLPRASLLSGNQLQRFQREASVAAQLHHSHVVPVFGSGESDGFHWYAMQFIRGRSLDQWREAAAATPPAGASAWRERARFVARIGAEAAGALHYAHGQGTLHRDVKPGNLLLDDDEHVWVTDFGLAKALEAEGLTQSSDLLGTLQYMAPEQFAGHYDARSEVYALGVTLYELLVLRHAFAGRTRSELMEQIRSLRPTSLRRACPDLPADLAIVIERAMAREPADRYADAGALEQDLLAFLDDRPIAARRHTAAQLLWRWCRQNRAVAALGLCAVLALLVAGVTGWIAYGVTDDALSREQKAAGVAARQTALVEQNLDLVLAAFGELFDALVGRDPALALDEDPDTGEQTFVAPPPVEPRHVELLQRMLAFYDRFAAANAENQALRLETARAHRRVGAIEARLGDLDAAATSYAEALQRFLAIEGRDVRREVAVLHVDYGQLEQRRGRIAEAMQRFRHALELLGADRDEDPRGLRFERAQAHFLLARRAGGPPGERFADRERPADGHLADAQRIVADLLVAEPQNPEFRALQARCLLEQGRAGGAARRSRDEAIAIFRDLCRLYPTADPFAYELCEALAWDLRRGPGGEGPRFAEPIARLREARGLADGLIERQPQFAECRWLRAELGAALGRLLARAADQDAAAAATLRAEAEAELRLAVGSEVPADGRAALRQTMTRLHAHAALADLLLDQGRDAAAAEQVTAILAAVRALVGDARGVRRLPPDGRLFEQIDGLLRRLGRTDVQAEWQALRARLPVRERPGRRPR